MDKKEYDNLLQFVRSSIAFREDIHSTKFIRDLIESIYGHNVKLGALIELIETSDFREEKKGGK